MVKSEKRGMDIVCFSMIFYLFMLIFNKKYLCFCIFHGIIYIMFFVFVEGRVCQDQKKMDSF